MVSYLHLTLDLSLHLILAPYIQKENEREELLLFLNENFRR